MAKLLKTKFLFIFFIYLFIPIIPISALGARDYLLFEMLVNSCYRDNEYCNVKGTHYVALVEKPM